MNLIKQLVLGIVVIAGVMAIWIAYVPSAAPFLERAGVYDLLGMEPPAAGEETGGGRSFGGGASLIVVSQVTNGQLNAQVSAIGDGLAMRSVTVRSDTTGTIRDLPVAPGS